MSKMSHLNIIEKYGEHRSAIYNLSPSILSCFPGEQLFEKSHQELTELLNSLCSYYPFISLLYLLDAKGKQTCINVPDSKAEGMLLNNRDKLRKAA